MKSERGSFVKSAADSYTLDELLEVAANAYPDPVIFEYVKGEGGGDTLADFVVREIEGTFLEGAPKKEQLVEAARAISKAMEDLQEVVSGLQEATA